MHGFDFETAAIESRPNFPPAPVGLAFRDHYYAWGHPTGNNTAIDRDAILRLQAACREPFVCHNSAFDLAVAIEKCNVVLPDGANVNDTLFLAFLLDPYGELSLKPLAERYLGIPPTERDAVRDWLYASGTVKKNIKRWGAHISKAPGDLVAPYAVGDVTRTEQLYAHLAPQVKERGMWEAYRRECELLPMLLENSARGVPLDHKRLAKDVTKAERALALAEQGLKWAWREEIGSTPPGNFDSNDDLADAIEDGSAKLQLPKTATGKRSVAKDALLAVLPEGKVKALLLYRSALENSITTYMRPWLEQGRALHCNWNQVRDYSDQGARTGRLSSSPNLQNLTNPEKYEAVLQRMRDVGLDAIAWLPNLRSYLVAPPGQQLFSLDFSQQELRMLAHYEDGALAQGFRDDSAMDVHEYVRALILTETGMDIPRKHVKTINFAKIYGAGISKLAQQMGVDFEAGQRMVRGYEKALPSVKELQRELQGIGQRGEFIRTLGGRQYHSEPAAMIDGQVRTFEYKLLNYLIQGSSADQTKQAMVRWWREHLVRDGGARFLMTIHDELVGCAPIKQVKKEIAKLNEFMCHAFELDVPMRTDAKVGFNFGEMEKVK